MPRIDELWAWVVEDTGSDDEGVPAMLAPPGDVWAPLMGADKDRAVSMRAKAQEIADVMGKPLTLRRSVALVDVETVHPRRSSGV